MDIKEMVTAWVKSIKPGDKFVEIPVDDLKLFLSCMAAMRTDHLAEVDQLRVQLAARVRGYSSSPPTGVYRYGQEKEVGC